MKNAIIRLGHRETEGDPEVSKMYLFFQGDYLGYYAVSDMGEVIDAEIFFYISLNQADELGDFFEYIKVKYKKVSKQYIILDFKDIALVPEELFNEEFASEYVKAIRVHPRENNQIASVQVPREKLYMVYDEMEQLESFSLAARNFPDIQIIPSSLGLISQQQKFSHYINFSLRGNGIYITEKKAGKLRRHIYQGISYESDFLNTILDYFKSHNLDADKVMIIIDGYAEMAAVLEDRLAQRGFRISRVHSRELEGLPDLFSFVPMYPIYSSFNNMLCVS